jgi:hypothetical protein
MRYCLVCLLMLAALTGCKVDRAERSTSNTQRQRDSAIGASRLPGAHGVEGALKAADSATARRAHEEAAGREP